MKSILLALLLLPFAVRSQKKVACTIYLPQTIDKQRLNIFYENGMKRTYVNVKGNGDTIVVHDTYYSQHVILVMSLQGATPAESYATIFYIDDRPATIRLSVTDTSNIFSGIQLKNAVDARSMGFNQMHQYVSKEHARVDEAYNKIMAFPHNDALKDTAEMLANIETAKKMDYIRRHGNQYYSFFIFSKGYVNSRLFSVDSLISIFHLTFPAAYKNSFEGKQALALLNLRKLREQQKVAPDFNFKDIDGNMVSLSQCRGKYVLINFWASWCVPCVKEFPALNELTGNKPDNKLVRIFINKDNDTTAFNKARIKYDLKGIHLFSNEELSTKYKAAAIPQVYLIDKEGKIIYDRDELKDYELAMLANIIKKIPDLN